VARDTYYRQCLLERPAENGGTIRLTTWIPERHKGVDVEPGVTLRVKEFGADDYMDGRWTVASVGSTRHPEARVKERAHNWQKYRAATDV
jgi:hypothetical protein